MVERRSYISSARIMGYKTQQVTGAVHLDQWIVYNKQLLIACFLQPGTAFRGKVCYPGITPRLACIGDLSSPNLEKLAQKC